MKITIEVPDNKYPLVSGILEGIKKLMGKDFSMSAETLKQGETAATKTRRKPTKKEMVAQYDELILNKKWAKPSHLKKSN